MILEACENKLGIFVLKALGLFRVVKDLFTGFWIELDILLKGEPFSILQLFLESKWIDNLADSRINVTKKEFRPTTTAVTEEPYFFSFRLFSFRLQKADHPI